MIDSERLGTRSWFHLLAVTAISMLLAPGAVAQDGGAPMPDVGWQSGPISVDLGDIGRFDVPAGYMFTGQDGTKTLMELMENPVSGSELGMVVPEGFPDAANWFVIFEYSDVGHVKDDDKGSLDAAAILDNIREGTEAGNEERKKRGWAALEITGWEYPPQYNDATHNIEWAVKAQSGNEPVVNYNTRILGRTGVMEANLVCDPSELGGIRGPYQTLLAHYSFKQGNSYAEFREGDRTAEYGLAGLVAGGAAVAAVKSGLFAKLWKFIVVAVVGGIAAVKKFFGKSDSSA